MEVDVGHPKMSRTLWASGGKRVFDIIASTLLILFCSPILLAAALAIKITSSGPLFFKHTRIGRNGVEFEPFKFRTMQHGRKHDAVELIPLDHPDITAVGQFLRRTKIDELPQIFNVLMGEMSLVGPRPDLPQHVATYTPFKLQRLAIRPGLTGLAQVSGSTTISWDERIRYDVHYIAYCSFLMDLGILLRTIGVVLLGESKFTRQFEDSPYYNPQELLGWDGHLQTIQAQHNPDHSGPTDSQ